MLFPLSKQGFFNAKSHCNIAPYKYYPSYLCSGLCGNVDFTLVTTIILSHASTISQVCLCELVPIQSPQLPRQLTLLDKAVHESFCKSVKNDKESIFTLL